MHAAPYSFSIKCILVCSCIDIYVCIYTKQGQVVKCGHRDKNQFITLSFDPVGLQQRKVHM